MFSYFFQFRRSTDENGSPDSPSEEYRIRNVSPRIHSLNETNEDIESTPMLKSRRECAISENEQIGISTTVGN